MIQQHDVPWSQETFKNKLMSLGDKYHIYHPFHVMMNEGNLPKESIQNWVANRFYYQVNIPIKDAAILSNCDDRQARRQWIKRITDHDGREASEGGIEAWIRLGEACGLTREDLYSQKSVLPGVRFAVDAYVNFARKAPWQEAVCASLTELFAPEIHKQRLSTWPQNYPWINSEGLQYFRNRLKEVPVDVDFALQVTLDYFNTKTLQERALEILKFKISVLWAMADAMHMAYIFEMPPASMEIDK